jgi:hypothetical protein
MLISPYIEQLSIFSLLPESRLKSLTEFGSCPPVSGGSHHTISLSVLVYTGCVLSPAKAQSSPISYVLSPFLKHSSFPQIQYGAWYITDVFSSTGYAVIPQ